MNNNIKTLKAHGNVCNVNYPYEIKDRPKEGDLASLTVYKEVDTVAYDDEGFVSTTSQEVVTKISFFYTKEEALKLIENLEPDILDLMETEELFVCIEKSEKRIF